MIAPWLSVIMPVFNGGELLRHALESVCAQGDPDIEVIVVDDGSIDGSTAIAQSFAGRVALQVVTISHTGNWVAASNIGYSLARGEYIQNLHQDDGWCPGRLQAVREALRADPASVMLVHPAYFINRVGTRVGQSGDLLRRKSIVPSELLIERLLMTNCIRMCAAVFRRDALYSAGLMDEALWYSADWDLWFKLAGQGPTIYLPSTLSEFRIHCDSQSMCCAAAPDFRSQHEVVFDRHWTKWSNRIPAQRRSLVERLGRLSIDLNVVLANGIAAKFSVGLLTQLTLRYLALGPRGWGRFVSHARIFQRCWPRIRATLSERIGGITSNGFSLRFS